MADTLGRRIAIAGLRSAGVRVRVTGADHARAPRPAVFVFNHQSQLDILVIAYVLRAGYRGIVKTEAGRYPVFGAMLRLADVIFVDRSDSTQARRALEPAVETLKSGISVAIAPEGRTSPTPRVLAFKKGAFHLAAQTGVPVIPVVIRNSGHALWRSSAVIRPGKVDVAVLAPIDTTDWTPDTLDPHIDRIRQLFSDTLTNWPEPDPSCDATAFRASTPS
jgi:putative phosphoserine phosphatase/1-acylglycerol-3-phosphate O-acyltransferase